LITTHSTQDNNMPLLNVFKKRRAVKLGESFFLTRSPQVRYQLN